VLCVGVYTGSAGYSDDDMMFVTEMSIFRDLSSELVKICACGSLNWQLAGVIHQVRLYLIVVFISSSFRLGMS
jgi:hypothetical protein